MKHLKLTAALVCILTLFSCNGSKEKENGKAESGKEVAEQTTDADSGATWQDGLPTVIDFYATWCGPCNQIAPLFDELKEEYGGKLNFSRVDVDKDEEMVQKYGIQAMPTFVFLDADGKEVGRIVGADSEQLKARVKELATTSKNQ